MLCKISILTIQTARKGEDHLRTSVHVIRRPSLTQPILIQLLYKKLQEPSSHQAFAWSALALNDTDPRIYTAQLHLFPQDNVIRKVIRTCPMFTLHGCYTHTAYNPYEDVIVRAAGCRPTLRCPSSVGCCLLKQGSPLSFSFMTEKQVV